MSYSREALRDDLENNILWEVKNEDPKVTVRFSYNPSGHIELPEVRESVGPIFFTYNSHDEYMENRDKAYRAAVNMYMIAFSETTIETFEANKFFFNLFYFSKVRFIYNPSDTRSYVRVGRLEFFTNPSSVDKKFGFKYDRKSERNPIFAIAFAGEDPKLYAITGRWQ